MIYVTSRAETWGLLGAAMSSTASGKTGVMIWYCEDGGGGHDGKKSCYPSIPQWPKLINL